MRFARLCCSHLPIKVQRGACSFVPCVPCARCFGSPDQLCAAAGGDGGRDGVAHRPCVGWREKTRMLAENLTERRNVTTRDGAAEFRRLDERNAKPASDG